MLHFNHLNMRSFSYLFVTNVLELWIKFLNKYAHIFKMYKYDIFLFTVVFIICYYSEHFSWIEQKFDVSKIILNFTHRIVNWWNSIFQSTFEMECKNLTIWNFVMFFFPYLSCRIVKRWKESKFFSKTSFCRQWLENVLFQT